ncbi:hypothetical protein A2303_02875 [Candidatus Falkowbacteria bacterium RIFOXYB2_FULL_47_14]|uniref:Uncharacterized protein n=1 Tax=Candidatus Falkowbacteria bacterium RIFOXYA2_FULL_47_19 TaxID=1797994 RepID=A0A1F5SLK8_9BACT|nr:MAG: hypothetical protein A2227_01950 [Candidatus Falkowbacteria bacterium RIFOXYA2_FULL_47_19]OGF36260.1 MAG: hypothetical protein A2468_07620 [Candidatus Falkowbacteria bacterium RIFOXYC2_FULL_46_15]OGF43064.1 MAG: hypothetical protein A2303_02875 [Candidatus Falkowbacteria bacterium RIFOXYB2_FULL_47_14]
MEAAQQTQTPQKDERRGNNRHKPRNPEKLPKIILKLGEGNGTMDFESWFARTFPDYVPPPVRRDEDDE